MSNTTHTAFYIDHNIDKDLLIQEIVANVSANFSLELSGLSGAIFSNKTLEYFIEEELRHEHFEIEAGHKNLLNRSSSGEQKKALLAHLIGKRPGFIVVDNVLDSLDQQSQVAVVKTLTELSAATIILQVFSRKRELLPFIQRVYIMTGSEIQVMNSAQFMANDANSSNLTFPGLIPGPVKSYALQDGPLVKMNSVSVAFDERPVLNNISWKIMPGEFWQLAGPNGSGKSTLLSLITGNSPKGYGQDLELFGRKKGTGETVWEIKEKIGYFTPAMTLQFERQDSIEQMIISGFFDSVGLYIKPTDRQVQIAREWLKLLNMYTDKAQPFRLYPEAHQRMILIARAMVKHPPLLILDEPTVGLDDEMTMLFIEFINKIAAETQTAILYVSHKPEPGLSPGKIFELMPGESGSTGRILY